MASGKHYDYAKSRKAIAYTHFDKPLPVSFAEEGKSLYAVGLAEIPFEFTGTCGRQVTIWLDVLVVPGLAWDLLLGQNHLAAMDVVTEHNARIQTFRAEAFGGLRVQCPKRAPIPRKALRSGAGVGVNVAGVSAFDDGVVSSVFEQQLQAMV